MGNSPWKCTRAASFTPNCFLNKCAVLFYSRFIILLRNFIQIIYFLLFFKLYYLNSTATLLCLCFYSLCYQFVNSNVIGDNNNNLYIRLSFHFKYDTDEEIIDFQIFVNNVERCDTDVSLPSHLQKVF